MCRSLSTSVKAKMRTMFYKIENQNETDSHRQKHKSKLLWNISHDALVLINTMSSIHQRIDQKDRRYKWLIQLSFESKCLYKEKLDQNCLFDTKWSKIWLRCLTEKQLVCRHGNPRIVMYSKIVLEQRVPNLSPTMYPFSIATDEHVPITSYDKRLSKITKYPLNFNSLACARFRGFSEKKTSKRMWLCARISPVWHALQTQ